MPSAQEQLDAINGLLDESHIANQMKEGFLPRDMSTVERVANFIEVLKHPKNKTAFRCVQLLNTVKYLCGHLKECTCPKKGVHRIHEIDCVVGNADLVLYQFTQDMPEGDGEIWMRVISLLVALQRGKKESPRTGYDHVPAIPLQELFEIAAGNPAAVTDAYAAMETLRGSIVSLQQKAGKLSSGGKDKRQFNKGFRAAVELAVKDMKEVANPQATDICAGLILSFAAWLSTQPDLEVDAKALAEHTDNFIERYRLRRASLELE